MASNFYIVHHTARLGVSQKYFENMESWWTEDKGKQFNENLHNAGIHIHKGMFINENFVFCIYEGGALSPMQSFRSSLMDPALLEFTWVYILKNRGTIPVIK